MKSTRQIILFLILLFSNKMFADGSGYSLSLRLRVESKHYIIIHFHDWTDSTRESRYKMISTDQNPFTSDNNYAYIECIDKATGNVLFKKPCTALTKIVISNDENYIVGISNIMLWNPYQLVVFSINGELIKKRHITCLEAKLDSTNIIEFIRKYPKKYSLLKADNRIYKTDNFYYIDFQSTNMPKKLGKAWYYLFNYSSGNHLSNNISETVTNWVYWFNESNPDINIIYKEEKLYSISLLDPKQKRIEIKIIE